MRGACAALAAAFIAFVPSAAVSAKSTSAKSAKVEFNSRNDVVEWIDTYRLKPAPEQVPAAVQALSKASALRDPEAAGFFVGFVAGRARRQSGARRSAGGAAFAAAGIRPMVRGARDRLFRTAGMEGAAAQAVGPDADAARP